MNVDETAADAGSLEPLRALMRAGARS